MEAGSAFFMQVPETKIINGVKHVFIEERAEWVPVLFEPLPGPQTSFIMSIADNILYGGARGGGKTECGLAEAARWGWHPDYKALILRRTFPKLHELMDRAEKMFPKLGWKKSDKEFNHKSGAKIRFGHCQHPGDVDNLLTTQYHRIIIDQAEEFTQKMITDIATSCRTKIKEIPARMILMCNWGGVGHLYLKKQFYENCRPIPNGPKIYNEDFDVWWQPELPGKPYLAPDGMTYQFIPAKVFENKYIMENDKVYVNRLKALPAEKRKSHLDGNPDVYVGQFFEEFNKEIHVVKPFTPSYAWKRWISLDYGSDKPFVAEFSTLNPVTQEAFTYKEYWAKGKTLKYHAYEIARHLVDEPHLEAIYYPHDMHKSFKKDEHDADSLIDSFMIYLNEALNERHKTMRIVAEKGIMGPNTRVMKWAAMKIALSDPWWYITANCKELIETLPHLVRDEDGNPDDIAECDFDHWAEAVAHFVVSVKRGKKQVVQDRYNFKAGPLRQRPIQQKHWLTW